MYQEQRAASGLIIHPGAAGDCLLTLPLAAYMKRMLKLEHIDFMGRMDYIEFYPGRTCVDRVRSLESIQFHRFFEDDATFTLEDHDRLMLAFEGYEQIVSFLGHGHAHFEKNLVFAVNCTHAAEVMTFPLVPPADDGRHVCEFYQARFQREQGLEEPPLSPSQTVWPLGGDWAAGEDLLEQAEIRAGRPLVIIQPGSGAPEKCWHLQNFIELATALKSCRFRPVFLLGPVEQERFGPQDMKALSEWPLLSGLSLTSVLQVLTQAELYVGNDSGISHLAAAMARPTIALFGPAGNPARYRPLGSHVTVLQPAAESFEKPSAPESEKVIEAVLTRL